MRVRTVLFLLCAFLAIAFTATSVFADDVITERTGTIIVITPDGTVTTVNANDPLPPMPPGTTITLISGTMTLAPNSGEYSVTLGDTVATVGAGDVAQFGFDSTTGQPQVESTSGTIETETNGVAVSIPAGGTATIGVDTTGGVTVSAEGEDVTVTTPDGTPETVPAGTSSTTPGAPTVVEVETETETDADQDIDNKDLEEDKEISPAGE